MILFHDIVTVLEIVALLLATGVLWGHMRSKVEINDRLHALNTTMNALVTGQQEIETRLSYCDKIGGDMKPAEKGKT